jgi:glucoamylase
MLEKVKDLLFKNIGDGYIVASPTVEEPNYVYHWIRDSAIVMNSIIDLYDMNEISYVELKNYFINYINFETKLLHIDSISHRGEPKFHIDGTSFNENWGRPQNDGPALRALTLMRYSRILITNNDFDTKLYDGIFPSKSIIKNDLEYVCQTYKNKSFDLWEETNDYNYFTLFVQYRALFEGSKFSFQHNDIRGGSKYLKMANNIKLFLDLFKNDYIYSHLTDNRKDNNLDSSVIIAHVITNDFYDKDLLKTIIKIIEQNKSAYDVNNILEYPLIGRYHRDHYYDGNPWILTTIYFVVVLKKFIKFNFNDNPEIKSLIVKILQLLNKDNVDICLSLKDVCDGYTKMIFDLCEGNEWAEQINKDKIEGLSAKYLTWNYASFISLLKN